MTAAEICFSVKATELPENADERAPVDIILALDKLRPMYGGKLDFSRRRTRFYSASCSPKIISVSSRTTMMPRLPFPYIILLYRTKRKLPRQSTPIPMMAERTCHPLSVWPPKKCETLENPIPSRLYSSSLMGSSSRS
jgi:hypothetical protein